MLYEPVPHWHVPYPTTLALEKKLTGIKIGKRGTKTSTIAYADDVKIIV
jgi:hypothetical protein